MTERFPGSVPKIWASPDRPGFSKTFELELDDHLDIQHLTRQTLPLGPTVGAAGFIALFAGLMLNFNKWQTGNKAEFTAYVAIIVIAGMLVGALLLKPARRLLRHMYYKRLAKSGAIGKPITSTVDKDGVTFTVSGQTITCPWDTLYALEEDAGTFYFWMSKTAAHAWPARLFASDEDWQAFRDSVQKWSGRQIASPALLARLGVHGRANLPD